MVFWLKIAREHYVMGKRNNLEEQEEDPQSGQWLNKEKSDYGLEM